MGLFSKRKTDEPLPEIDNMNEITFDLQGVAESAGGLVHAFVKNERLMTYITKTLGPKLVKPAMMQDLGEVSRILKADQVIGQFVKIAYASFLRGYTNE